MKRLLDNFYIDLIAASLMIGMAATGYILRFPLPPGSNKSLTLWTLTRHQWGDVHFWISLTLLAVILLHLVLHWQWVVVTVRRKVSAAKAAPGSAWLGGLLTSLALVAGMALFAWAAHHGVEQITEPREGVCPNPTKPGTKEMTAEPDSATGTTSAGRTVGFWKDVYPILDRSCLSCHGPKKQRGGFRADRREDFFGAGGGTALVVPGKSAESPLIAIVSGQKDIARPDVHRLPAEQVEILRSWIDAGASWPERP
jgi:mono/diheme cytochrome c family protein